MLLCSHLNSSTSRDQHHVQFPHQKLKATLCSFLIRSRPLGNDLSYAFKLEYYWKTEPTSAVCLTFLLVQGYTWGLDLIIQKRGKGGEEEAKACVWENVRPRVFVGGNWGHIYLCVREKERRRQFGLLHTINWKWKERLSCGAETHRYSARHVNAVISIYTVAHGPELLMFCSAKAMRWRRVLAEHAAC